MSIPSHSPSSKDNGYRKKIFAENLADWTIYGGVAYAGQATASVVATEWVKNGPGKQYFEKAAEWTGKNILERITTKRGPAAVAEANTYLIATALIMVGNFFVPLVKKLEDYKPQIVCTFNDWSNEFSRRMGHEPSAEEVARQQEAIHELEQAPKKSWGSLWTARAGSLATVYAAAYGIGEARNKVMQEKTAELIGKGFEHSGIPALQRIAHHPRTKGLAEIAFVDFAYSIIAAGGLYAYSNLLSGADKKGPADEHTGKALENKDNEHGTPSSCTLLHHVHPANAPCPGAVKA